MPDHSPEPWTVDADATYDGEEETPEYFIWDSQLPRQEAVAWGMTRSDAQRACACVNACRGVSNKTLNAVASNDAMLILGDKQRGPLVLDSYSPNMNALASNIVQSAYQGQKDSDLTRTVEHAKLFLEGHGYQVVPK